jgi:hypothetical protein
MTCGNIDKTKRPWFEFVISFTKTNNRLNASLQWRKYPYYGALMLVQPALQSDNGLQKSNKASQNQEGLSIEWADANERGIAAADLDSAYNGQIVFFDGGPLIKDDEYFFNVNCRF